MKNKLISIPVFLFYFLPISGHQNKDTTNENTGIVKISFVNTIKGKPVELNTARYINPFAEEYSVSKLKYYISHVSLAFNTGIIKEDESYHLVDESKADALSFSFAVKAGTYHSLSFMLGVDSLKNVSGAQTGALDPLNDMFWTWNSGYIMAKLEGSSPQSKVVNNKVEFHIGGFCGVDNVLKNISLNFPSALNIPEGKTGEIIVEADIDKWWQQPNDIKITEHPVCTTPGALAKKIADNYSKMFTIKKVITN